MPPARARAAQEDSRSEGSSTREKQAAATNQSGAARGGRRNGASVLGIGSSLKDVVSAQDAAAAAATTNNNAAIQQNGGTAISWMSEDVSVLQRYRYAHRLDTPSAFASPWHQALLTNPGIGGHSPTMARKRDKRRVGKEQLALAVRKNFNGSAVNENEVVVDLLYKVRAQDKSFRAREQVIAEFGVRMFTIGRGVYANME
ncbi:hypothetical protein B0A49_00538 [Cryomyces minteri]|uniref:Histone deacetylase complex subunit SAP30 Sin3 binding domain-containing protein n=1 Tax=Cryomyces minteri TaxID=331657 RepID=A0A4U0XY91_9PEZI|nr:hypothetical protein B0A49_00538 [Cryomyces minteri]